MITFRTLSAQGYTNLRFAIVKETEQYRADPYNDGDFFVTIGYGFNLEQVATFRTKTYAALGFDTTADANLISQMDAVITAPSSAVDSVLQSQLNQIGQQKFGAGWSFVLPSEAVARGIFDNATQGYENSINSWISNIPESSERAVLFSLVWNGGAGLLTESVSLKASILNNDRAEAWYQIRYQTNGDAENGIAKRRYMESEHFGLYDGSVVSVAEAKNVFQMYAYHRAQILNYDTTYGSMVAQANDDYDSITILDRAESFAPALNRLLSQYAADVSAEEKSGITEAFIEFTPDNAPNNKLGQLETGSMKMDRSNAGAENALFLTGIGADVVHAGAGDDIIIANEDNVGDELYGDAGNDWIIAGNGNDTLNGGTGADKLFGGVGNDILDGGGAGAGETDELTGGFDLDGADRDTFIIRNGTVVNDYSSEDSAIYNGTELSGEIKADIGNVYSRNGLTYIVSGTTLGVFSSSGVLLFSFKGAVTTAEGGWRVGNIIGRPYDTPPEPAPTLPQVNAPNVNVTPGETKPSTSPLPNWLKDLIHSIAQALKLVSPLVLDLNGDGVKTTALTGTDAVYWDSDNDGFREASGWVSAQDGLLVRDLNSNGVIDDHSELFGTNTTDGFVVLRTLNSNSDNKITAADAGFGTLKIWQDADGDAVTQMGELKTLAEWGITEINLGATSLWNTWDNGNQVSHRSTFVMNGVSRNIDDVWFAVDQVNSIDTRDYTFDPETLFLPEMRGYGNISYLSISMSRDATLKAKVQEIADTSFETLFSKSFDFQGKIDQIMYRWAGVENVDPTSLGPNTDARKLAFLNVLTDDNFTSHITVQVRPQHETWLNEAWTAAHNAIMARLLMQTNGSDMFVIMPTYNYQTDEFTADWELNEELINTTFSTVTSKTDLYKLWATVFQIIDGISGVEQMSAEQKTALQNCITTTDPSGWLSFDMLAAQYSTHTHVLFEEAGATAAQLLAANPLMSLVSGTDAAETITGTAADEVINALGGVDIVNAGAGNDILMGGTYADTLNGEDGDDVFYGGSYADQMNGGNGNDVFISPENSEVIDGGAGYDKVVVLYGGTLAAATLISIEELNFRYSEQLTVTAAQIAGLKVIRHDQAGSTPIYLTAAATGTYDFSDKVVVGKINFTGTTGNDIIIGSEGDDTIHGNNGSDQIDGGAGNDVITGAGYAVTPGGPGTVMHGGAGDDVLTGSYGIDQFFGDDGDDVINYSFLASGETIDGGNGYDRVMMVSGGNLTGIAITNVEELTVTGTGISFTLSATHFNYFNKIVAASGSSSTFTIQLGAAGNYTLAGKEIVGTVTLRGTTGVDTLTGRDVADILYAGNGNDTLIGGAGNDLLGGGSGTDTINAGDGDDIIDGTDNGFDIIDGGAGYDVLRAGGNGLNFGSITNVEEISGNGYSNVNIEGSTGADNYDFSNILLSGIAQIRTGNGNDTVIGSVGDDAIYGDNDNDTINAGAGNDTLNGGRGNDTLNGGDGNDTLDCVIIGIGTGTLVNLSAASLTLNATVVAAGTAKDGSGGTDTISGVEQIIGTGNADWIYGGAANETILGGVGNDTLNGGAGNDVLVGGSGTDTLDFSTSTTGALINLSATSQTLNAISVAAGTARDGFGGTDMISEFETVTGSAFADWLYGSANADTLIGAAGNDTLNGDAGDDILIGGAGNDVLIGGAGTDIANFSSATATVLVNLSAASQTLNGTAVAAGTVRDGLAGTDTISGVEKVIGSAYADWMYGGANDDTFLGGAGNDVLTGGAGIDTAEYSSATATVLVNLSSTSQTLNGTAVAAGTARDGLAGTDTLSDIENIIGSAYADWMYGSANADTLSGGEGIDNLNGDAGDDILIGGARNDVLNGGAGSDTVDYSASTAAALVNMSTSSQILGSITMAAGTARDGVGGTDTLSNIEKIIGTGYADWIYGSANADTFTGGAGNDNLTGGLGNDQYLYNTGFGADTITDTDSTAGNADVIGFGSGFSKQNLWFAQSGNNLLVNVLGTTNSITVSNWYTGTANQIEQFSTNDGMKLDSQLAQLVTAMASYAANNTGFNPTSATVMPTDTTLQTAITAAWHA